MLTAHFTGTQGTPDSTTSYYMGGQFEVKDGATKKYYSMAGMRIATPPCPPQIRNENIGCNPYTPSDLGRVSEGREG